LVASHPRASKSVDRPSNIMCVVIVCEVVV
jgi:hypothetical protein